ncbi:MAG TPA: hypothetical protein VE779_10305, partial [Candidatus Angelobacter sp.]|nr:hypothetical protein [Candidatus Angelobacter sp.]
MQTERKVLLGGILAGAAYGLAIRAVGLFHPPDSWLSPLLLIMSCAFVFVVPFSMGYITIAAKARHGRVGVASRIVEPWLSVLLAFAVCGLALWEGAICIVMLTPVALICSSVGGLAAGATVDPEHPRVAMLSIVLVGLLPFATSPIERRLPATTDLRSVESSVMIHAGQATIWQNIERVAPINGGELPRSWNRTIGFPRPIEATLDHEGIGGVRHATFAGDVLFIETIDVWEPWQRLGFSIHADTKSIPPTTLDEHVTVGGQYFDVLHGEYILESVTP